MSPIFIQTRPNGYGSVTVVEYLQVQDGIAVRVDGHVLPGIVFDDLEDAEAFMA